MLENEIQGNPWNLTDILILSSYQYFLYTHAACYSTLWSTLVYRMINNDRVNAVCGASVAGPPFMHILTHKYCTGCSVFWCCSCFQLLPLSQLCLFSRLVHCSRKMLLIICFNMSWLYAGHNVIPVFQGRPTNDLCMFKIRHWSLKRIASCMYDGYYRMPFHVFLFF